MLKEKQDVYKPPAVIHHDNTNVSLLQKKAWSWLIANAYDELATEEIHNVPVADLIQVMDYNSNDQEHLKDALRGLMTTLVEWNLLGHDKENEWQAATLLAGVRIKSGTCYYSFEPMFRRALHHPEVYARLSLKIISQFSGKYALNLWEMCMHAMNPKTGVGETSWWEVNEFRRLVGIKDGMYKQFRDLNKRVIQPAIGEIELLARCRVTPDYKRKGRTITHIKFRVARITALDADTAQGELFPDTEGLPNVVAMLVREGVHHNKAMKIWSEGFKGVRHRPKGSQTFEDYVAEKIDLLHQEVAKGRVKDKAAWLIIAIRDNYQNPDYRTRKQNAEIRERITKREAEAKRLEYEQDKRVADILETLAADNDNLKAAFEDAKTNPLFKPEYLPFADNLREAYQDKKNPFFTAIIDLSIKDRHFDRFKPVDRKSVV